MVRNLLVLLLLFFNKFCGECSVTSRSEEYDYGNAYRGNSIPKYEEGGSIEYDENESLFNPHLLQSLADNAPPECRIIPNRPAVNDDTNILSLWDLLDKSRKDLLLLPDQKDVVLLLGNTGSGKTTITQLVAGNSSSLEVVETEGGDIIIIDPLEKIGRTTASRTLIPELVVDPETGLAIYDAPGFSDNRGPNTDITVNFLLKKVTDHIQSVKLVFTVIFSSVNGLNDKTDFDRLATSAVKMVKNLEKMENTIGLIVTKVPIVDERGRVFKDADVLKKVKSYLQSYKNVQEGRLNEMRPSEDRNIILNKIKFVEIFLKNGNNIGVMKVPKHCGFMTTQPEIVEMKDKLKALFTTNLKSVGITSQEFGYALTDASLNEIENGSKQIGVNVTVLSQKLAAQIYDGLKEKLLINTDFQDYSKLLEEEYSAFDNDIKPLLNCTKPEEISEKMKYLLASRSYDGVIGRVYHREMSRLSEYLNFFIEMKPDADPNTKSWMSPFSYFHDKDLGRIKQWAEFLSRLRQQLASYDFQRSKPSIQVPPYPELDFVKRILSEDFVGNGIQDIFTTLGMDDREYLKLILEESLHQVQPSCLGNELTLKGSFVKASDFCGDDGKYKVCPGANIVKIYATQKFFIDVNISPDKSRVQELVIYAPVWEAITGGMARIDLDGIEGQPPSQEKADKGGAATADGQNGTPGQNGIPGKPGGSGGRFYGVANSFINGERLVITANGGRGGSGQIGGDGSDGKQGRRVKYSEFPSCWGMISEAFGDKEAFSKYFDKLEPWNTDLDYMVTKRGDLGGRGGNGGNGGAGGIGGLAGTVAITNLGYDSTPQFKASQGDMGQHALGGNGGAGGKTGNGTTAHVWTSGFIAGCGYDQINEELETKWFSRSGNSGSTGGNSAGRRDPQEQSFSLTIWKSLQDFKAFLIAEENLRLRNRFIQIVEGNHAQLELCHSASFSYELLTMESNSLELRKSNQLETRTILLLGRYSSYLQRLEEYARTKNAMSSEERKILSTLYATALSRKTAFSEATSGTIVVNIDGYFKTVLKKFARLKEARTTVVVNEEREVYAKKFQDKVQQAMQFIQEKVNPGIEGLEAELAKTSNELLQQIAKSEADFANQESEAKAAYQQAKSFMALRHLFTALKVGTSVVSMMGPQGAAIGGIIGSVTSVAESFGLPQDTKNRPQIPLPSAIKKYADNFESKIKDRNEDENKRLDVLIEHAKKAITENKDLKDVQIDVERLEREKKELDDNRRNLSLREIMKRGKSIQEQEKNINQKMSKKLQDYQKAFEDQASSTAKKDQMKKYIRGIQAVKYAVNTVVELGYDIYNTYKNDAAKLENLNNIVEKAAADLKQVRDYKEHVTTQLLPLTEGIADDLQIAQTQMEGASSVSLQVQKWEVKQKLGDFKFRLQDSTEGYAAQKSFIRLVDKLSEAVTMMIDLYDFIDKYAEQTQLADYIATIHSPDALKISINNPEVARYISRTEMALQSNILLGEYDRVVQTFKQWVFPFGDSYTESFKLPSELSSFLDPMENGKTADEISLFLIPRLEKKVQDFQDRVKEYKNRYFPNVDVKVIDSNFNSDQVSTDPFFTWGVEARDQVKDLFAGKAVTFYADPDFSYRKGRSAVKFSVAEIQPKTEDPEMKKDLDNLLKNFAVEMTHSGVSHYMYDDKQMTMVGENVTLRYNFERVSGGGEREGQNEAYVKFKNGDLTLSPYTLWTVRLLKVKPEQKVGFDDLKAFVPHTELELVGKGSFVDEKRFRNKQETVAYIMYINKFEEVGGRPAPIFKLDANGNSFEIPNLRQSPMFF